MKFQFLKIFLTILVKYCETPPHAGIIITRTDVTNFLREI